MRPAARRSDRFSACVLGTWVVYLCRQHLPALSLSLTGLCSNLSRCCAVLLCTYAYVTLYCACMCTVQYTRVIKSFHLYWPHAKTIQMESPAEILRSARQSARLGSRRERNDTRCERSAVEWSGATRRVASLLTSQSQPHRRHCRRQSGVASRRLPSRRVLSIEH